MECGLDQCIEWGREPITGQMDDASRVYAGILGGINLRYRAHIALLDLFGVG